MKTNAKVITKSNSITTKEVWGIFDLQLKQFREEEYSSKEEAIQKFSKYWKEMVYSDIYDGFDFEEYKKNNNITHELTEKEEQKAVKEYLASWDSRIPGLLRNGSSITRSKVTTK